MMKKLMAAVLALFFAVLSSAAETDFFTDVAKNKWYYSEIKAANEAGLMVGKSAAVFDPDGRVTRAEFAAILSRIDGADLSAVPAASFSDVKHGAWYEKYVSWAASAGIIKGYKDGTVRPNSGITRQELAVMIARYADSRGLALPVSPGTDSFTDGDSIAGWAKNGAEALRLAGIFVGDKAGRFLPLSNATRAEVAALSNRLLGAVNTAESTVVIAARGKRSAYTVIYPPDRAVYAADIVDLFPERLGRPVPNGTDSADPSRFEILYGETNRPESAEVMDGLAEYDYRIKVFFSDEKVTVAIGYHHYYAGADAAKALFDGYCNGYELRVPKDLDFAGTHEFDLPRGEAPEIQSDVVPLRDPFVLAE
ncbi:MAG: S-layer homology domain-containing protein [Clostridia bacterium]|nr:S-layer homology domain-containing protein [Clostridia bacterium]